MAKWHIPTQIKLALFSVLMLLVPLHFWHVAYQGWDMFETHRLIQTDEFQTLIDITYSGSMPYAILTSVMLVLILLAFRQRQHAWQSILVMCVLSMGATQLAKSAIKQVSQEPRPYVVILNQQTLPFMGYEPDSFYRQPEHIQHQAIDEQFPNKIMREYMKLDMGFSFPSGHTIFAVSWLLLFVGLLSFWGQWLVLPVMAIWAVLMAFSRVRLGMHYPIDLFVSILLAWAWHGFLFARILPQLNAHYQTSHVDE